MASPECKRAPVHFCPSYNNSTRVVFQANFTPSVSRYLTQRLNQYSLLGPRSSSQPWLTPCRQGRPSAAAVWKWAGAVISGLQKNCPAVCSETLSQSDPIHGPNDDRQICKHFSLSQGRQASAALIVE